MNVSNRIAEAIPVRGESAYLYGLKDRARRHHCLGYGMFSVDMSRLEEARKRYSRCVRPITYKPIFVKATALAIERTPEANAILFKQWLGYRIVRFERVDVNLPVTRDLHGRTVTFIATIRDAAAKPLSQIQDELTAHQRRPPEECFALRRFEKFSRMPLWLARLIHWRMTRSPRFYLNNVGTCGLTFLEDPSFERLLPIAPTSVVFGLGGVQWEPVVRGEEIVKARVMKCTLMVDNFVISGPVGLRLAKDFRELLETGSFVADEIPAPVKQAATT
ncbi:MAG: 2-oxo acid dehydrogenase subunit E2 [Planctomycetes bacterium]|nr:2-oxo acid dehydrogenase subunit E2 [Planctomycetota bacterium]